MDARRNLLRTINSDGIDYVAMPYWKVFMIQFLNIAGTGPIFGAIMGAKFGPVAYLWIIFGCIFAGAVHDYLSGMLSLRNGGSDLPSLVQRYLGGAAAKVLLVFAVFLLIMVGTVFVYSPAEILGNIGGSKVMWMGVIFAYYIVATMLPIDKIIGKIYYVFSFTLLFMAVALLVNSYFLYRIRRSERSGDTLAFKPLQRVVRWVVALLGGAGLGLVFAELFSGTRELPVLLSCMVGLGLVCMIGSQMLIAKTPRIFKKLWPELIALCVVIVGITLCIKADVFGYESRIPSVEQVVDAKVNMNLNYKSGPCVTRDPEEIAAIIEAHKYFQQREREEGENAAGYGRPITLTYFLESSTLSRRYDLRQEDVKHILPMLETESFRRSLVMLTSENPSVSDFRTGYYNLWGGAQQELTAQQSQALYKAITDDAAHMDMTAIELYQGEQCKVDIYLQNLDGSVYAELYLNTHCTRTLQLLQ